MQIRDMAAIYEYLAEEVKDKEKYEFAHVSCWLAPLAGSILLVQQWMEAAATTDAEHYRGPWCKGHSVEQP